MTDKKAYEADTPRKTHAVKRKLIMDIEDLVEIGRASCRERV